MRGVGKEGAFEGGSICSSHTPRTRIIMVVVVVVVVVVIIVGVGITLTPMITSEVTGQAPVLG